MGIKTGRQEYFSSQSWSFPGQLMLAYFVEYLEGDIQLEEEEIAEADWFSATEIEQLENIPPDYTISGQLIRAFVRGDYVPFQ